MWRRLSIVACLPMHGGWAKMGLVVAYRARLQQMHEKGA
jgi:hypothetical protein